MAAKKNTDTVSVDGFVEVANCAGFAPRNKDWTDGSELVSIEGMRNPDDPEKAQAFVSKNGNKYWILVFADGCRFTLLDKARRSFLYPTLLDGSENPNYLNKGIYPGMKFEAKHIQSDDGITTILRYVD